MQKIFLSPTESPTPHDAPLRVAHGVTRSGAVSARCASLDSAGRHLAHTGGIINSSLAHVTGVTTRAYQVQATLKVSDDRKLLELEYLARAQLLKVRHRQPLIEAVRPRLTVGILNTRNEKVGRIALSARGACARAMAADVRATYVALFTLNGAVRVRQAAQILCLSSRGSQQRTGQHGTAEDSGCSTGQRGKEARGHDRSLSLGNNSPPKNMILITQCATLFRRSPHWTPLRGAQHSVSTDSAPHFARATAPRPTTGAQALGPAQDRQTARPLTWSCRSSDANVATRASQRRDAPWPARPQPGGAR